MARAGGFRALLIAAAAAVAAVVVPAPPGAVAQDQTAAAGAAQPILIVDKERVLRESAAWRALAEAEQAELAALRAEADALQLELETEENVIAGLRDSLNKDDFDERVRAFDTRVRSVRVSMQTKSGELNKRFGEAQRRLADALSPVLQGLIADSGATLILDARDVLAARPGADRTEEALARFDAFVGDANPLDPGFGAQ